MFDLIVMIMKEGAPYVAIITLLYQLYLLFR